MRFVSGSPEETKTLGKKLAGDFLEKAKTDNKKALIISCEGELGTGKTVFIRGLAEGFGIERWIKSPTFILMREHIIKDREYKAFYHLDCYRLKEPKEVLALGLKDLTRNPQNVIVIEWGNRIKNLLPPETIRIKFKHLGKQRREISLE